MVSCLCIVLISGVVEWFSWCNVMIWCSNSVLVLVLGLCFSRVNVLVVWLWVRS